MFTTTKEKAQRAPGRVQFEEYESARKGWKKKAIEEQSCQELIVDAQLEEEAFSPVVRKVLPRRQRRCWQ